MCIRDSVEIAQTSGSIMFYFPRDPAITLADKEVVFVTRMGPLALKAKFPLKNMVYQGKLDL